MSSDNPLHAPCGTFCGRCAFYATDAPPSCPGCGYQRGRLFWGDCKVYACAQEHAAEHCGLCDAFPCDLFIDSYDPAHGPKSAVLRAGLLAYRKRAGTQKYLDLLKRIGQS